MKLVLPIVLVAIALGVFFPRANARVWTVMAVVIVAVISYFYLKT